MTDSIINIHTLLTSDSAVLGIHALTDPSPTHPLSSEDIAGLLFCARRILGVAIDSSVGEPSVQMAAAIDAVDTAVAAIPGSAVHRTEYGFMALRQAAPVLTPSVALYATLTKEPLVKGDAFLKGLEVIRTGPPGAPLLTFFVWLGVGDHLATLPVWPADVNPAAVGVDWPCRITGKGYEVATLKALRSLLAGDHELPQPWLATTPHPG